MRETLTVEVLRDLPTPPPGRRVRCYDVSTTGFAAVKLPSGQIRFTLDYGPRRHRRRVLLGTLKPPGTLTLSAARELARLKLAEVIGGGDPVADRSARRHEATFAEWKTSYVSIVKGRKKTWRDDARYLSRAVEWWGPLRLSRITTEHVQKVVEETRLARGKISANRFLASVRASLQAAWRLGKVPENVAAKVTFYPENPPRARVLDAEELERVLAAVAELANPYERTALTLIIETGCRKSEALGARWGDVDLDAGLWRIPSPKAGYPQTVPLAGSTVALLRHLPRLKTNPHLFPGRAAGTRRSDLRDVWASVRQTAGVPDATIHDLRRSFGLEVARSAGLHVASRLLRHSRVGVTERVYAPLGIDELRKASEKVGRQRAKRGKVLRMKAAR